MAKPSKSGDKSGLKTRKVGDKAVIATLYNGNAVGHGKYFAGMVDNALVCDNTGKPLPLREVGVLV